MWITENVKLYMYNAFVTCIFPVDNANIDLLQLHEYEIKSQYKALHNDKGGDFSEKI